MITTPVPAALISPLFDLHTHHEGQQPGVVRILHRMPLDQTMSDMLPCSIGLHPWQLDKANPTEGLSALEAAAQQPQVFAIGECGLDKACDIPMEVQEYAFRYQLSLAERLQKPVIIHCVRAFDEVLSILRKDRVTVPVIFHGYRKGWDLARQILSAGHRLSFGRQLLQPRVADVFRAIPPERVFLETDDGPTPIGQVYAAAAAAYGVEQSLIVGQLWTNAQTVFGKSIAMYG